MPHDYCAWHAATPFFTEPSQNLKIMVICDYEVFVKASKSGLQGLLESALCADFCKSKCC